MLLAEFLLVCRSTTTVAAMRSSTFTPAATRTNSTTTHAALGDLYWVPTSRAGTVAAGSAAHATYAHEMFLYSRMLSPW